MDDPKQMFHRPMVERCETVSPSREHTEQSEEIRATLVGPIH